MCEIVVTECSQCEENKSCTLTVDPLMNDIYNGKDIDGKDLEHEYWCAECIEKRADDI